MSALLPLNKSYWLQQVCETNYAKLLQLLPDLTGLEYIALEDDSGKPALHARLIERSRYTLTLELTHYFSTDNAIQPEPAVQIRLFLDAKLAEVMCADTRPSVYAALAHSSSPKAMLDYKWHWNYFLEKWLDHCLQHNYRPIPSGEPAMHLTL